MTFVQRIDLEGGQLLLPADTQPVAVEWFGEPYGGGAWFDWFCLECRQAHPTATFTDPLPVRCPMCAATKVKYTAEKQDAVNWVAEPQGIGTAECWGWGESAEDAIHDAHFGVAGYLAKLPLDQWPPA